MPGKTSKTLVICSSVLLFPNENLTDAPASSFVRPIASKTREGSIAPELQAEPEEAAIPFRNAQGELLSGKEIAIIIGRHWRKRSSFDRVQISSNYSFQLEEDSPRRLVIEFFIHPNHSFVNT